MEPTERDLLLTRLEERTANIWRVVEKLEKHNADQNGFILKCLERTSSNKVWIRTISGVGGSAILFFLYWIVWGM